MYCVSGEYISNPDNNEVVFTSLAVKSETLNKVYKIKSEVVKKSVLKSAGLKMGTVTEEYAFCDIIKNLKRNSEKQNCKNILVGSSEDNIGEIIKKLKSTNKEETYKVISHYTWLGRDEK